MAKTFFFYDLETSGLSAQQDRIMQFAGQRTSLELEPIGEPVNELVALSDDTLPNPDALMVTGITPQQTVENGYSEAQFAKKLTEEVFTPDTIAVGFNNVRFDDEFIRHLFWRNFYDPYEWTWKEGRSRWDMLDVVRLTRALRPEGINWPVTEDGKATNRLELLTKVNHLSHAHAHDALSDVEALIEVTRLIKQKQPRLYGYLFDLRDKNKVKQLVNLDNKRPFVYASGRYEAEFEKTTVAFPLTAGKNGNVVVYDLRYDPTPLLALDSKALATQFYAGWKERQKEGFIKLPVKELQYNRVPAVAPLGVLAQAGGWEKISLDEATISTHLKTLLAHPDFAERIRQLFENRQEFKKSADPEAQLYDGFLNDRDRVRVEAVRNTKASELADFHPSFSDERLNPLLLHYKARNYPRTLSQDEEVAWQTWRLQHVNSQLPAFVSALERLAKTVTSGEKQFVLEELHLWLENVAPNDADQPD